MTLARRTRIILTCALISGMLGISANAAEISAAPLQETTSCAATPYATESFHLNIPAKSQGQSDGSFPLAAGEIVTIKAYYSPSSANVDFGLVSSNGLYYYFTITDGNIDKAIQVNESGSYTLQIRNNSDTAVEVSGFVNY